MNKMFQKSLALIMAICTSATMAVSAVAASAPVVDSFSVTIEGTAQVDKTLTAKVLDSKGKTVDSGTYQWLRDSGNIDVNINGATSKNYKVTADDLEHFLRVSVTWNGKKVISDQTDLIEDLGAPDKTDLGKAIAAGDKDLKATTVSTDGKELALTVMWVTQADWDDYNAALTAAQTIYDKKDATEAEITTAVSTLAKATKAFNDAKKPGGNVGAIDTTRFDAAIAAADAVRKDVEINTSAANVASGAKWVTQAEYDKLYKAVEDAVAALETVETTDELNAIAANLEKAVDEFKAAIKIGTKSSGTSTGGGSSSGSSGSSSSSTGTSSTPSTTPTVSTGDATKTATASIADAVKQAVAAGAVNVNAPVGFKNVQKMTPDAFQAINAAAAKASGNVNVKVTVQMDTVVGGKIAARLYIDPVAAAKLTTPINTLVDTSAKGKDNAAVAKTFDKYFANEVAIATFGQAGSFGMSVPTALKMDLSKLNTQTLKFYSYDKATNTVTEIANPAYFIDTAGYLHFNTNMGGSLVVTDKALAKK